MLNNNPKFKTPEDTFKSVQYAFKHVNMMNGIIDKAENKLKNERNEIENSMMDQKKRFETKIAETKASINLFKDRGATKQQQANAYLYTDIANINKDLKFLVEERERINQQQVDLDQAPEEYLIIDDLKP
jgi:membrane-associated HD superfamily phosphohydrolase